MIGARFAPFQNLTAHYLLADLYLGAGMTIRRRRRPTWTRSGRSGRRSRTRSAAPEWVRETWEEELVDVERRLRGRGDLPRRGRRRAGRPARARLRERRRSPHVQSVYVDPARPAARGRGGAHGGGRRRRRASTATTHIELDVLIVEPRRRRGLRAARLRRVPEAVRRLAATSSTSGSAGSRAASRWGACLRADGRRDAGRARGRAVRAAHRPLGAHRRRRRRGTAGSRSTTSSAAATRRRCAGSARSSPTATGGVVLTLGDRGGRGRALRPLDRGSIADEYASRAGVLRRRCRRAT